MTKRTETVSDDDRTWAVFKTNSERFNADTALQGKTYSTELEADEALRKLKLDLTADLQNTVIVAEVGV